MRNQIAPTRHAMPSPQSSFLAQLADGSRARGPKAARKSAFRNVSMVSQEFFGQGASAQNSGIGGIEVKVARLESMDAPSESGAFQPQAVGGRLASGKSSFASIKPLGG